MVRLTSFFRQFFHCFGLTDVKRRGLANLAGSCCQPGLLALQAVRQTVNVGKLQPATLALVFKFRDVGHNSFPSAL